MNKFTKVFLMVIASLFVLGIILFSFGINRHGAESAWRLLSRSSIVTHGIRIGGIDNEEDNGNVAKVHKGEESDFLASEIENIEIAIGATNAVFKLSEDDRIHVINESNQDINAYIMSDKLKIKSSDETDILVPEGTLYIAIPYGLTLEKLDMDYGAAKIECENDLGVKCDKVMLDIGAGDVTLAGINADGIEINLGAGNLALKNVYCDNLGGQIGMGNMDYSGDITGDMEIDCSMGNVTMLLDSSKGDHNLSYSVAAGNLSINNEELSGLGESKSGNADADSSYNIELSMGNVELFFADKL